MNDMSMVIEPKSDQINADDLISGPRTITIAEVRISPGTEQPVQIHFEGDNGKPWRPCKSMSRVLVQAWGPDAKQYIGRSVTLKRDPTVKWGGLEVGGIRISHLSHIENDMVMALTATRGQRKPFKVQKLAAGQTNAKPDPAVNWTNAYTAKVAEAPDAETLDAFVAEKAGKLAELEAKRPELHAQCIAAVETARSAFDDFGEFDPETGEVQEGRADADMGEGFTDEDDTDAFGLKPLPAKEETPSEAILTAIRGKIAAAKNVAGLKHVDAEWVNARGAYDDETAGEIDALLVARRMALQP